MGAYVIDPAPVFSLIRVSSFAGEHRHAFAVRGTAGGFLFKEGVPRNELLSEAGLAGSRLHLARQVHGATVLEVPTDAAGADLPLAGGSLPEADALISRRKGHAVGVSTADCVPILLAAHGGECSAIHAGWRGLLAGVVESTVKRLCDLPDSTPGRTASNTKSDAGEKRVFASALEAAVGPAIGPCCFEVGPEVADRFRSRFPEAGCVRPAARTGKSLVDLPSAAVVALEEAGLEGNRIYRTDLCTRCRPELLESYRRDGERSGRMIAFIGVRAGSGGRFTGAGGPTI